MSRNTSNQSSGNDGSWFLEAVGAKAPEPPHNTFAELTSENEIEDAPTEVLVPAEASVGPNVEVTSFDGDPGTSTSSFAPIPAAPSPPEDLEIDVDLSDFSDTSEMEALPVDDSSPSRESADPELTSALRSRRNFRWPVVIALGLLIVAVGVAAVWLPASVRSQALSIRTDYYDGAAGVRTYLPTAQEGLDAVTNPESSTADVSNAVPIIAEFDTRTFSFEDVMSEPLPSTPPLVPSAPIEELEPFQDSGSILAAASSDIARHLGNAYVYRTSIPLLLVTGDLPVVAMTQEINEISVTLASSLAEDAAIVADLPDDPAFVDVRILADTMVDRYGAWQDEYLAALTSEDAGGAQVLVKEMDAMQQALADENTNALLAYRAEADLGIVDLAARLDDYLAAVSR